MAYGITEKGFTLKRLYNIIADIDANLSTVQDPVTGETLNLDDENDPLVLLKNAVADQLAACWEVLEVAYNQFDPLKATEAGLSGLVQLNEILRQLDEVDTGLRLRQQGSTAATAYRQVDAIYSALINVPNVQFARVYQNSTLDVDVRGLAPKSVAAVVVGGTDEEIGVTLFGRTPIGVAYHGNTLVTQSDEQGVPYDIYFVRPTAVPISVVVNVQVNDVYQWPTDGEALIKQAIVDYAAYGLDPNLGLPPGADLLISLFYTPVNTVKGHKIISLSLARDGGILEANDITLLWNEVATFSVDDITVNVI